MFGTLSEEAEVKVEAGKAWQFFSSLELGKAVGEHVLEKLELVEGDGGVGSVLKCTYKPEYGSALYKEKFLKIDDENMVKEVEVLEGRFLNLGFNLYRLRFEIKENPKDGTGSSCVVKSTIEFEVKEEAASNATLAAIDQLMVIMKVANEHLMNST